MATNKSVHFRIVHVAATDEDGGFYTVSLHKGRSPHATVMPFDYATVDHDGSSSWQQLCEPQMAKMRRFYMLSEDTPVHFFETK